MENIQLDKFVCGFFVGVILYFLLYNSVIHIQTPITISEIEILQQISDQIDSFRKPEVERELTLPDLDRDLKFHHG